MEIGVNNEIVVMSALAIKKTLQNERSLVKTCLPYAFLRAVDFTRGR